MYYPVMIYIYINNINCRKTKQSETVQVVSKPISFLLGYRHFFKPKVYEKLLLVLNDAKTSCVT